MFIGIHLSGPRKQLAHQIFSQTQLRGSIFSISTTPAGVSESSTRSRFMPRSYV
jgi:hypothetical protein